MGFLFVKRKTIPVLAMVCCGDLLLELVLLVPVAIDLARRKDATEKMEDLV